VFVLQLLQGRDPDWVLRPFFARFDSEAIWFDELQPAFGTPYFFEAIPEQELVRTAVC
jgi:hypothetical protein